MYNIPYLVMELIDNGIEVTIRKDPQSKLYYDLNSGMKSYMHLYPNATGQKQHVIKMRYDEQYIVEDLYDVKIAARKAMHGRNNAHYKWHEFMQKV